MNVYGKSWLRATLKIMFHNQNMVILQSIPKKKYFRQIIVSTQKQPLPYPDSQTFCQTFMQLPMANMSSKICLLQESSLDKI